MFALCVLWLHLLHLGILRGVFVRGERGWCCLVDMYTFAQSKFRNRITERERVREWVWLLFRVVVTLALAPHQYTVRGSYKNQTQKKKYTKKENGKKWNKNENSVCVIVLTNKIKNIFPPSKKQISFSQTTNSKINKINNLLFISLRCRKQSNCNWNWQLYQACTS